MSPEKLFTDTDLECIALFATQWRAVKTPTNEIKSSSGCSHAEISMLRLLSRRFGTPSEFDSLGVGGDTYTDEIDDAIIDLQYRFPGRSREICQAKELIDTVLLHWEDINSERLLVRKIADAPNFPGSYISRN